MSLLAMSCIFSKAVWEGFRSPIEVLFILFNEDKNKDVDIVIWKLGLHKNTMILALFSHGASL